MALSVAFPPMATVRRTSALFDSASISSVDATNVNNTAWSYIFLEQSMCNPIYVSIYMTRIIYST